jgi:hypothetical protein
MAPAVQFHREPVVLVGVSSASCRQENAQAGKMAEDGIAAHATNNAADDERLTGM